MPDPSHHIAGPSAPQTAVPRIAPSSAALPDDAGTHSVVGRVVAGLRRRLKRLWRRACGQPDAAAIEAAMHCLEAAVARGRQVGEKGSLSQQQTIAEALRLTGRRRLLADWRRDESETRAGDFKDGPTIAQAVRAARVLIQASSQAARAFEQQADALPQSITPDDGRLMCVRNWLAAGNNEVAAQREDATRQIADVGCGSGRFIRALRPDFPHARWTGVDVAQAMLERLPPEVVRVQASLLDLPCPDDQFDAAFCVEAIEHTLYPRGAVEELCRIVKPGGRVLIIDKRRERQGSSDHEPWERWFTAEEVSEWLAPYCDKVEVQPLAHGRAGSGLFLAWSGVIR